MKKPLPNIFNCTAFKKHVSFLLDENQNNVKFSNLFLYLPSTLDRKEEFLYWKDNVYLHPVDLTYDDIKQAAGQNQMDPSWLDNKDLRNEVTGGYYKIMRKIAEVTNQNLVRNSDSYISSGGKVDPDKEFCWIDDSCKLSKEKFQLNY